MDSLSPVISLGKWGTLGTLMGIWEKHLGKEKVNVKSKINNLWKNIFEIFLILFWLNGFFIFIKIYSAFEFLLPFLCFPEFRSGRS